jgi:hypothetical protein
MANRVNAAFKALMSDDSLLAKFRTDPGEALRSFELLECELDAIKSGDQQALLTHGLDPQLITGPEVAPHWFSGLLGTVARRMAAPAVIAILLALGIHAADTQPASAARASLRARTRIRQVRTFGPSGLRRASLRANVRSSARRARVRISVRAKARYLRGIDTAFGNVCEKCGSV